MADDNGGRQDYEKKGGMTGAKGGGSEPTGGTGPTGSSRSYPKGKGGHMRTDWNPQKAPASTYGINGCS